MIKIKKQKKVSESQVIMTELVLPNHTNLLGNLLGGQLMHWVDVAGAMAASRHANCVVATVAVDSLEFRQAVKCGEIITICAKLVRTGNTSMEVKVETFSEVYQTGEKKKTNKAFLTFVALDKNGNKTEVPKLIPETEQEKIDMEKAIKRYEDKKG